MTHEQNAAWTSGRIAGLQLKGIGTNPHVGNNIAADAWEDGYKAGRDERERRPQG